MNRDRTQTQPKAESIGSNPLSPVPEGLKDEAPRHRARICPKCGKVTTSFECCFERGSPMFPQTDDYTVTQPQDVVLNADHESGLDRAFAAGYRAGLNEAREVVEGLIEDRKAWVQDADADVESHFGETGRKLGQKAFQKNCEIAGLDEARAALVSLGKEGDGK